MLNKKGVSISVILLFFAGIIFSSVFCNQAKETKTAVAETYLNHSDTAKYTGMQTCRACHNDIYETFIETGMGKSFGAATREKSSAKFTGHDVVYDKFRDFYYQPFWAGNTFYIKEYRLKNSDTVYSREEKVDYIIGSGQHTNSHLMEENGYFTQMPLTFYTQKGKWDLPPGFEDGGNNRFSRKIELECMSCHNAYPDFVEGSENKFATVLQGIDCERCHGPGQIHAIEKAQGKLVDTAKNIDYTIVNPKKLSYNLQIDLCQRCHLQGNAVLKPGKTFFDYRPGKPLSEYMNIFLPRYEGNDNEFIMASHADRLQQSKCFVESKRRKIDVSQKKYDNSLVTTETISSLTCISCHNPHVSVKATKNDSYNNSCKNCHSPKAKTKISDCSEKLSIRKISNDNCWSCHMPKSGTIDIPHVTVHDHRIQIKLKDNQQTAIKKFVGLAAINNPNPDDETMTEAYLSYFEKFSKEKFYLDSGEKYLSKLSQSSSSWLTNFIRLNFLRGNLKVVADKMNTFKPENVTLSWDAYRVGEAFSSVGNNEKAYQFYARAVHLTPKNLDFNNKLATTALSLQKIEEAQKIFEFIIKENNKHTVALGNLGYIYMNTGRKTEAESLLKKSIQLDPDYENALLNMAYLQYSTNRNNNSVFYLNKLLAKNPGNSKAKELMSKIKSGNL